MRIATFIAIVLGLMFTFSSVASTASTRSRDHGGGHDAPLRSSMASHGW